MPVNARPSAVATRLLPAVVLLLLVVAVEGPGAAAAAPPQSPEPVPAGRERGADTGANAGANAGAGKAADKQAAEKGKDAGAADGKAAAAGPERLDPAVVYRFDPIQTRLVAVRPAEIKRDHVYYRYSAARNRHVWSKAAGQGRFLYRMGPGSVQPAQLFDIRATDEEKRKALESRAPMVAKLYASQGAQPALRLDDSDRWTVAIVPSDGSVFDLETGRRFEWHGDRVVEVVHSGGNNWARRGDRYTPAAAAPVAVGW